MTYQIQLPEPGEFAGLNAKQLAGYLAERRDTVKAFLAERKKGEGVYDLQGGELDGVRKINDHLSDAQKRWVGLRDLDAIESDNNGGLEALKTPQRAIPNQNGNGHTEAVKTLGEQFTESLDYKRVGEHRDMDNYSVEVKGYAAPTMHPSSIKATMTTAAGYAPANNRTPLLVPYALRRPVVADLIPITPTDVARVKYMEVTTFTNAAAPVAENAAKPEAALAATERSQDVEVIATYLPVTNQQLDDVAGMRDFIDENLTTMLALTEETQLLTGDGTSNALLGFLEKTGTNSQPRGSDSNADAVFLGIQKIRTVGFAEPSGVVLHPNNWTPIRLMKTTDGQYIWGPPSVPGPDSIWGLPVIQTTAITEGTGLTGDFRMWSRIYRRMGITIVVGWVNDDLIKNKRTILAEMREALVITRAAAFTVITDLQSPA
jgi:HK97 family phage major capsid protein